ncbi:hypothetical protein, partial [Sphaerotilus sulfidivorans]|uniref:hypothetical protein n=1 Tax=Sphaerotilus sulfidivorans TaxID=639200 RepID=UPI001816CD44
CRCWTRPAPGSPDPCGLQHPAGHVGEPGEHLASAGPLPRLDVLGTGRPRPLRPAGHAREPGEHLADAGRLPGLVPWPSSWCSHAAVDLAGPDPLPLLDAPGAGQPRPLRPVSADASPTCRVT